MDSITQRTKYMDRAYFKDYYIKHKDRILGGQTSRWRLAQEFLTTQKMKPCTDCGFIPKVPDQMDFDHIKGIKIAPLARLTARGVSIVKILEEIDKCDLVCANCHRLRTAKRRNKPGV